MAEATKIPKQNKRYKPKSVAQKRLNACVWLILGILIFAGLSVGLHFLNLKAEADKALEENNTPAISETFGIKEIDVQGNHHYTKDQILAASNLYIGKSIWKVSKSQTASRIKSLCPYVENVHISSKLVNQWVIQVEETTIAGAIYSNNHWLLIGANGKGLDTMPVESDIPMRYIYYKGAVPTGKGLGKDAMDERCTEVFKSFHKAFLEHEVKGICEVDLSDLSNILVNWNNQITICIGNDSNIEYEIAVFVETLPKVLKNHGEQANGTLDISSYSDPERTNQVIFTPAN